MDIRRILEEFLMWTGGDINVTEGNKHEIVEEFLRGDNLSIPLEPEVDVKTAEIEFRPDRENIDEIVAKNVDVHLEYMDDSDIWMSILDGKDEYHIHIQTKRAHIKTWAEIC
jgi:hypothetical protein